jgi:uncharacterized DUF497 family protein
MCLRSNELMIGKTMARSGFIVIGMAKDHILLYVAYTERDQRIRIISARRATQREQDDYFRQNAQSAQTNDRRTN